MLRKTETAFLIFRLLRLHFSALSLLSRQVRMDLSSFPGL